MKKEEVQRHLGKVFTRKQVGDEERTVFADEYLRAEDGTDEQAIYEAVSRARYDSGISFELGYSIAEDACSILAYCDDWEDLHEAIDSAVPIYYAEIMKIYASDWSIVDEACEEFASEERDSSKRAQVGWYRAIEQMTRAIASNVEELVDDNNETV